MRYSELSTSAKATARDDVRAVLFSDASEWWLLDAYDSVIDRVREVTGINVVSGNIFFSLGFVQSDYARIDYGEDAGITPQLLAAAGVDVDTIFSKRFAPIVKEYSLNADDTRDLVDANVLGQGISSSGDRGGYSAYSVQAYSYVDPELVADCDYPEAAKAELTDALDETLAEVDEAVCDVLHDLEKDAYWIIRDDYMSKSSDEEVEQFILDEEDEHNFDEDGHLV